MGARRALPRGLSRVVWRQAAGVVARLLDADGSRRGGASVKTLTLAPGVAAKKVTHAVVCETLKHVPLLKLVLDDAGVSLVDDVVPNRRRRRDADDDRDETKDEDEDAKDDSETDLEETDEPPAAPTGVARSLAYVLSYEALFGAGLEPDGEAKPSTNHQSADGSAERNEKRDVAAVIAATRLVVDAIGALQKAVKKRLKSGNHKNAEQFMLAQPGGQALAAVPTHSRYARVNTLKTTLDAVELFLARGGLKPTRDEHVPDLLAFPPNTDLHDHPLVKDGRLILQGKSSCFPALALLVRKEEGKEKGAHALDACAAPGNKTTHLASLVGADGKVFAFDADARRLKRLTANCLLAGAMAGGKHKGEHVNAGKSIVAALRGDFLQVDPFDPKYARVKCVLLDPSCSGSGTAATRGDYLIAAARGEAVDVGAVAEFGGAHTEGGEQKKSKKSKKTTEETANQDVPPHVADARARVASLAAFQTEALRHALSFPSAERVSYSTCSVYPAENERVVAAVLPDAMKLGYTLEKALPSWPRRGLVGHGLTDRESNAVLRADQFLDDCEGFFVAVFVRKTPLGAKKAIARADKLAAAALEEIEAKRLAKRMKQNGSEGVRPVYGNGGGKKRKKGAGGALFR